MMITRLIGAMALIASFGLGAFATQVVKTQASPPAYFVTLFGGQSDQEIMDTDYPSLSPGTFQQFGGHYIIHSGRTVTFDGQPPMRIVVIAFDSMERLQAWHRSDAFERLYDIHKITNVRAFAVEGVAPGTASIDNSISQR
jgi:uncharacterized protein (DUF1330 family)